MKQPLKRGIAAFAVGVLAFQTVAQPVGQWDFDDSANRLKATVGGDLTYADGVGGATALATSFGTASSFGIPTIGGQDVVVMKFPAATAGTMGFNMPVNAAASGGGSLVNSYTLIMDILFPLASDGKVRGLVETDGGLNPDADFKVNAANSIGGATFSGNLSANQWHRIAFAFDGANIRKYINGVEVGTEPAGLDGRWALSPLPDGKAVLFTDDNGESQVGYVSSVQLRDTALTLGQILALGGATGAGIPQALPPVPAFVETRTPAANAVNVGATTTIDVVLNKGDSTVPEASVQLLLDGTATGALPLDLGPSYNISHEITELAEPGSTHTVTVNYTENGTPKSVSWKYTVVNYQKITLPTPIHFENFDALAEATLPAGWSVTNRTTVDAAGEDLANLHSDSYLNWVVVSESRLPANRKQLPLIVLNGETLAAMTTENLIYAESDVRSGEQVQTLFTKDYDLTGHQNVFVVFKSLYAQNQDNVNSLEYSVDEGATWNPLLIMVNGRESNSDIIRLADGTIDAVATLNTARADQAWDAAYGAYLAVPVTQALAPFISPRIDDNQTESKRIEMFRLPLADNKPKVRFRFMQAGTASWYWGVDDFGLYTINTPVITAAPANRTVDAGSPAEFTVVASGSGTLSYQWQKDGNNIAGATAATYTIASAGPNDVGNYRVIVSNADGPTTSSPASLTVISAPQITTQPVGATISASTGYTFTVAARGGQPLSYKWQKDGVDIPGANSASYQISGATAADAGLYRVIISNSFGGAESSVVQLSVTSGPITAGLVAHYKFDNDANDSSGRNNHGTPSGQEEAGFTLPTYASSGQLIGTHALHAELGQYIALGSPDDFLFGTDSFSVSFWVKSPADGMTGDPSFIGNKNWGSGGNPGFTVAANWQWNWAAAGSPRRDADDLGAVNTGNWHHIAVSHDRNSVASFYLDGVLKLTVPIVGDGSIDALTLNILQDGTGGYGFANDRGARFLNVDLDDFGIWRRALSPQEVASIHTKGRAGQDLTTATFTGVEAPTISTPPANLTVFEGFRARFTVTATGTPPFTYQWKKGGSDIPGATADNYTIAAATEADEGSYSVVVSNSGGPTTSAAATLTVNPAPTAQVTGQWDFENGDLSATVGAPLEYRGDTAATTTFSTAQIGGQSAKIMGFPKTTPTQGFVMPHGAAANGGGTKVNNYTLIMDIMFPAASHNQWRALLQTSPVNSGDGDLFVNSGNGIGISGNYSGTIVPETWHRVAFTVNSTDGVLKKFIDGVLVGQQTIATTDGRFSLEPTALLFTDEDGETSAGFANSIQFRNWIISDAAVTALGGATAGGIPGASTGPKLGISRTAGVVTITVDTAGTYQLQRKASLADAAWTNVGAPGTGPFIAADPGFYQVQRVP